jgi:cytochrome P450
LEKVSNHLVPEPSLRPASLLAKSGIAKVLAGEWEVHLSGVNAVKWWSKYGEKEYKRPPNVFPSTELFGVSNIVHGEGEKHALFRKVLNPVFLTRKTPYNLQKLESYSKLLVSELRKDRSADFKLLHTRETTLRFVMAAVGDVLWGIDMKILQGDPSGISTAFMGIINRVDVLKNIKTVRGALQKFFTDYHQAALADNTLRDGETVFGAFSNALEAGEISEGEILDNLCVLCIAGTISFMIAFNVTSIFLTNAMKNLALYPHVQQRLYEEVKEATKSARFE